MLTLNALQEYKGLALSRGVDFLYILPHPSLRKYISCYTFTFPAGMSDGYTILPSASASLVMSVSERNIFGRMRGTGTRACTVGAEANKMKFLLLVEFQVGCLYPFIPVDQNELTDCSPTMCDLDAALTRELEIALLQSERVTELAGMLDRIFFIRLKEYQSAGEVSAMLHVILSCNGNIGAHDLTGAFYYSEKHIRRMFMQYIGTNPHMLARIARVNYALRLLKRSDAHFVDIAETAGFYDQSHFIHDFKRFCGLTPSEYRQNMSVFYNDEYKI